MSAGNLKQVGRLVKKLQKCPGYAQADRDIFVLKGLQATATRRCETGRAQRPSSKRPVIAKPLQLL